MLLTEEYVRIPRLTDNANPLAALSRGIANHIDDKEIPVRIAITKTDSRGHDCEVGILSDLNPYPPDRVGSIFHLERRSFENTNSFNAVLLVPTGIGAELGGHSGDAGPLARLLADCCDCLVTHPNVVNAADINELPENGLYVEGSVISRLLMGTVGLQKVRSNRVLMVLDDHTDNTFCELAINSVSAARAALGLNCPAVVQMTEPIIMRSLYAKSGRAAGRIEYLERLCSILEERRSEYDAVALSSRIQVPEHFHADYFRDDLSMINPWGGVEAMLTHAISMLFNIPSAHSPMMSSREVMDLDVGVVDPRKSAEAVSTTYLHCILKGLHNSPRIIPDAPIHADSGLLTVADISCLVIPDGCIGLPTLAALEQEIPVIAVRENRNCMENNLHDLPFQRSKLFIVDNYLEAAGVMAAIRAGVPPSAVRRPLSRTEVAVSRHSESNHEQPEPVPAAEAGVDRRQ